VLIKRRHSQQSSEKDTSPPQKIATRTAKKGKINRNRISVKQIEAMTYMAAPRFKKREKNTL